MQDQTLTSRTFGTVTALQADSSFIEFSGQRFAPDPTKAYARFTICHGFPCITAYGTSFHPGTIGNSYQSLLHQMVDYDHQVRIYDDSKDKTKIPHDKTLGFVAAVDYPRMPSGGWKVGADRGQAPAVEGVMGIFKNAQQTQRVLGEYLTGRHKWTVSIEANYSLLGSGFVVGDAGNGTKGQRALMDEQTPPEMKDLGFGYVTVESAPPELVNCFDLKKRSIVSAWNKLPVSLLMGGINGDVHLAGVGIVRYGAEREAEIQQMLAHDPDRIEELGETDLGLEFFQGSVAGLATVFRALGLEEKES